MQSVNIKIKITKESICWQCEITGLQRDARRTLKMQFRGRSMRLPLTRMCLIGERFCAHDVGVRVLEVPGSNLG